MSSLKSASFAAFALFLGASYAQASDLPRRTDPYAASTSYGSPSANWQGAYLGVHVGGGWGSMGALDTSGFVGGVQGGYNLQYDRVVIGGELDFSGSNMSKKSGSEKASQDWLATARGRFGYSFGNILPYATLGLAMSNSQYKTPFGSASDTNAGWTIGAGAEMLVMPNITLRAEYLRYELGNQDYPTATGLAKVDNTANVIRAGVNYKF